MYPIVLVGRFPFRAALVWMLIWQSCPPPGVTNGSWIDEQAINPEDPSANSYLSRHDRNGDSGRLGTRQLLWTPFSIRLTSSQSGLWQKLSEEKSFFDDCPKPPAISLPAEKSPRMVYFFGCKYIGFRENGIGVWSPTVSLKQGSGEMKVPAGIEVFIDHGQCKDTIQ